ncbi:uncharacterized protein TNCV_4365891 [Trichonephila clavipes]|nr:uncharacterized protein TNCV_4365891 [Trichonephila clavipes]
MFMKLKCPDCDKQTLKLALGNKVGFSYLLNLTCSSCAEKVCAVEMSNERQCNTVPDINLRITQECINHVGKRLGTGLRNAVKESRARGISLGGKGHGTLKEATIKKLALYYQKAIVQNKGNVSAMKKAIYATLHHSISTDQKPQLSKCAIGADSWCSYQSAKAKGQKPGLHKQHSGTPINESFLPRILSIYQRLASN